MNYLKWYIAVGLAVEQPENVTRTRDAMFALNVSVLTQAVRSPVRTHESDVCSSTLLLKGQAQSDPAQPRMGHQNMDLSL